MNHVKLQEKKNFFLRPKREKDKHSSPIVAENMNLLTKKLPYISKPSLMNFGDGKFG